MKKPSFIASILIVWILCIASLFGVRSFLHRKPKMKDYQVKINELLKNLDNADKTNVLRFESSLVRLDDNSVHLIGRGFENEEERLIENNRVTKKKIDFRIDDPLLLERQMMVNAAYKYLNEAEKKCLADKYATIIYSNGEYYLLFDSMKYPEYVKKYGTKCKPCSETQGNKTAK